MITLEKLTSDLKIENVQLIVGGSMPVTSSSSNSSASQSSDSASQQVCGCNESSNSN